MLPSASAVAASRPLQAGLQPDGNLLTGAGRSLQKHGDRPDSVFPRSAGTAAERNANGQRVLEGIVEPAC